MRNKIYGLLFLILIPLSFNSCIQFNVAKGSGVWFYTYTSSGIPSEYNLTPASFICLQPDHNYILDFGKFEHGKWERAGDTIILQDVTGNMGGLLVTYSKGKSLGLSIEPGVVCDFESQPYSFSKEAAHPFSFENNTWRIRATRKETPVEIKQRVINHCRFWKAYFTWALDNDIAYIDVRSTPSPIKIYGNGFALERYDEASPVWQHYFYDSADYRLAYDILDDVFTNKIAWAHSDSKYKKFIGAYEQLEQMVMRAKIADHN